MKNINRYTLGAIATLAFAGCGSQVAPTGGAPQAPTTAAHGKSWMLPEAKNEDLIYATGGCGGTCILSYPDGKLVGTLDVGDAGVCADSAGNVFIANETNLFEYAHGGTSPIATLSVSGGVIGGCSVDATTGGIAATVEQSNNYNVAVFPNGSGSPATYLIADLDVQFCGYDNQDNLFVDGYGKPTALYELPEGTSTFINISLNPSLTVRPGQVQWDGKYITVEGLGTTTFKGITRDASQSWIENNRIFIPYGSRGSGINKTKVGVWKYPAGRKNEQLIKQVTSRPDLQGVAFSAS
jgi:hypothetical protein